MKAVLYLRMSSDRSGDELGVTRQREDCIALAAARGWEVIGEFVDNDTSAAGKVARPNFEAMLTAIKSGGADVVIAWNLDRLTRNRRDTVRLIEIGQDARLVIALARGTDLDMSTPMGRMMADQLAGWARYEIEQKSERHKRANEQRAKSGLSHKGRRAYGYSSDGMTLVEDEALVLKEIATRFLSGYTYTQLADWLNDCGYTTTMGNPFYSVAIRQMLQRKRYVGIREHDGVEYQAQWPAVWDEDTWARIQHRIRERSASVNFRPMPRRHLLTGLVFCGSCGATMNGTTTYDRKTREPRKTYRCNRQRGGCGRVSRGSVPLKWWIKECICFRLDSPDLAAMLEVSGGSSELMSRHSALEARLIELLDAWTDGTLTKAEYKRAKERITTALEGVQRDLDRLNYDRTLGGLVLAGESIRARWDAENDGWRRNIIDLLIERITVNPTRKLPRIEIDGKRYYFASEAVDIVWRK